MTVMLTPIFQGVLHEQESWASTMTLGFIASFNNNVIYIYILFLFAQLACIVYNNILACIVYNNIRLERIKCLRNVSDEKNRQG